MRCAHTPHVRRSAPTLAVMLPGRYFNPDDYFETGSGRVFTPERSTAAFDRAYVDLEAALLSAAPGAKLFVVVGAQGAGKTTWIRSNADN